MVSVILTILFCVLSYLLGALVGWQKTVKMQRALRDFRKKTFAESKPAESPPAK